MAVHVCTVPDKDGTVFNKTDKKKLMKYPLGIICFEFLGLFCVFIPEQYF